MLAIKVKVFGGVKYRALQNKPIVQRKTVAK